MSNQFKGRSGLGPEGDDDPSFQVVLVTGSDEAGEEEGVRSLRPGEVKARPQAAVGADFDIISGRGFRVTSGEAASVELEEGADFDTATGRGLGRERSSPLGVARAAGVVDEVAGSVGVADGVAGTGSVREGAAVAGEDESEDESVVPVSPRSGASPVLPLPAGGGGEADIRWVGEVLRQAREEAGLSLEAVAKETRIRVSHLAALEAGRVDRMPGLTFVVGFLRIYARFLNLPEGEVVERFTAAVEGKRSQLAPQVFDPPTPARSRPGQSLALGGLLLLIVLAVGFEPLMTLLSGGPERPERTEGTAELSEASPPGDPLAADEEAVAGQEVRLPSGPTEVVSGLGSAAPSVGGDGVPAPPLPPAVKEESVADGRRAGGVVLPEGAEEAETLPPDGGEKGDESPAPESREGGGLLGWLAAKLGLGSGDSEEAVVSEEASVEEDEAAPSLREESPSGSVALTPAATVKGNGEKSPAPSMAAGKAGEKKPAAVTEPVAAAGKAGEKKPAVVTEPVAAAGKA
ncbi:MAG: helix-turn-helix domain-containing protein, partial [Magnetococcales bacterium]|nr:helix-turn-helix domain-containing protein [Magnetococcales bacterium]